LILFSLFAKKLSEIPFTNRERFSSGIFSIDYIYGETRCVHTEANGLNKIGDPLLKNGQQIIYNGMPTSFISVWAGEPGVGKSRLAIAISKQLISSGTEVLYLNGENEESDIRKWCGPLVSNSDLFKIYSNSCLEMDAIEELALQYKTPIIFIDSFQTIKGKTNSILQRLKLLKANAKANMPHIVLISQVNKSGKVSGTNDIQHESDFVATVTKSGDKEFCFECLTKNRAGPTPRGAYFKHLYDSIQYLNFKNYNEIK